MKMKPITMRFCLLGVDRLKSSEFHGFCLAGLACPRSCDCEQISAGLQASDYNQQELSMVLHSSRVIEL
ncbi:hypothetical protein MPTK1_6g11900 [Marchantia polymorpha subsp. ruderalis]|uniref:Uncharacterized protein n=1 Tax=Marchantia polymorpha subsp. ruderalis TaxID=1480154 RepID=A0AAF6BR24_MARPO|nr:hypothetical protein Mp_6g11900 [Marchantia polymorpha subsp. ruderalis]